jgi:DNA mismatch endonuclease (patch repair protein)
MRRVRSVDTFPELFVRRWLHRRGFRFRLHRASLPGTPDIVLPRHRVVVFVHGCFWHRHEGCPRSSVPKTNVEYWTAKFARNVARDAVVRGQLAELGWTIIVVWECEIRAELFAARLLKALEGGTPHEEFP